MKKILSIICIIIAGLLSYGCEKELKPIILDLELLKSDNDITFQDDTLCLTSKGTAQDAVLLLKDLNGQDFNTDNFNIFYDDEDTPKWCSVNIVGKEIRIKVSKYENKEEARTALLTVSSVSGHVQPTSFTVKQLPAPKGSDARIISFSFEEQASQATINHEEKTVRITVIKGTILKGLVPTIEVSEGASITPESGTAQDFTSEVKYTVTSEDKRTISEYTVNVSTDYGPNADKADFLTFSVEGQIGESVIDTEKCTVDISVSASAADLTNINATATISEGATITPEVEEIKDFTEPVEFTITSEDKTNVKTYVVSISPEKNSEALLKSFIVGNAAKGETVVEGVIDDEASTVTLNLPYSDKWPWSYTADYTAEVSLGAKGVIDFYDWDWSFKSGAKYTVTSEDESQTKVYEISCNMDLNPNADLLTFCIFDPQTNGPVKGIYSYLIDNNARTITVRTGSGADLSNLHVKVSVSKGAVTTLPDDGIINLGSDYTFSITSEDGSNTVSYTVMTSLLDISAYIPEMIDVETGETFVFGSNPDEKYQKYYAQDVTLTKDFRISKFEITQDLFEAVMGINESPNKGERYPITNITWYEAAEFCNRLSELSGLVPAYEFSDVTYSSYTNRISSAIVKYNHETATGYRLPTNAEFEWAAKGGKLSQNFIFAGGNDPKEVAWYSENTSKYDNLPQEVGGKLPNELGLYDMSGNADEWVYDWYLDFENQDYADYDPIGGEGPSGQPSWNDYKIFRGGAASSAIDVIIVNNFRYGPIDTKSEDIGFRIAITK